MKKVLSLTLLSILPMLFVSKTFAKVQTDDHKTYYVDADAHDGGDGTVKKPFNSFETVVGHFNKGNYMPGLLKGGDHLYLKGSFTSDGHDEITNNKRLILARPAQGGTAEKPTVIKSYGKKKAVFDPNYKYIDPVYIRNIGGNGSTVVIQDIEVTRSSGRGIMIADGVGSAVLSGIVGHHNQANGNMGSSGAVVFDFHIGKSNHVIRDSEFYSNQVNPDGHPDNRGAVSMISKSSSENGSTLKVINNIFCDEHIAVRQKHSGNVCTTIEGNLMRDCTTGVFLRAFENHVLNNKFRNVDIIVSVSEGNAQGDLKEVIRGNSIDRAKTFIKKAGNTKHSHDYEVTGNTFESDDVGIIFNLAEFSNIDFDLDRFKSTNNVFKIPKSAVFLKYKNKDYGIEDGEIMLKDDTSKIKAP